MDYKYITQLLERYWQCATSLEEEEILRAFFSQSDIPSELQRYQALFQYEQAETKKDALGDDFDERMLAMVGEPSVAKARTITMARRLMPLFRAAAVVAIILTLGNAMQVQFDGNGYYSPAAYEQPSGTTAVAIAGDSLVSSDSLQQSQLIGTDRLTPIEQGMPAEEQAVTGETTIE
ncbi:MAG: pyruvate ferredoxin oxidoreductase [Prevotella sp.]|nr:pyruvate ferredoxin oxidoreductase [Prevotella sp.]